SQTLWIPFFIISDNYVSGLFRRGFVLVFQLALCPALGLIRLLFLTRTLFLPFGKGSSRVSAHQHSYTRILTENRSGARLVLLYVNLQSIVFSGRHSSDSGRIQGPSGDKPEPS